MRDFYIPFTLDEGKAYIDRVRTLRALNDNAGDDTDDRALLGLAVNVLDSTLSTHRRVLRHCRNLGASIREFPIADGWFVPIAPRTRERFATLERKAGPRKPRDVEYGQNATRLLYSIARDEYPDDPDKITGYCGLMLYRINDAVWWIELLARSARARSPYLVDSLAT